MVELVALDELPPALGLGRRELVSLVGGGGKTTALFALGAALDGTVVLTTTTKMFAGRTDELPVLIDPTVHEIAERTAAAGTALVWSRASREKAHGVTAEACDRWFDLVDHVVVEADGSRQLPVTAPGPFEPVVPSRTTTLVSCVGAAAFGRVIADRCHRPLRVAAAAGCSPYERLTPERLGTLVTSERGLAKSRPPESRHVVLVGAATDDDRGYLDELAAFIGMRAAVVATRHLGR